MATSIFYNGRLISVPGSYSEVDASGLESVGLSAAGIVAVLGTARGGKPVSAITEPSEFLRANKPEAMRALFRSGDLREVAGMLFEPSSDPAIQGGVVEAIPMKVNPATQSSLTLGNAYGDSIVITSEDYGADTEQIKVSISDGTVQGKLVSVQFEDQTEAQDDLGGDDIFTLKYEKPTNGWDTMEAQVAAGGVVKADATRDVLGLDSDVSTPLPANGTLDVFSNNAGDIGPRIEVFGLDATGTPVKETFTLNGTTTVTGSQVFKAGSVWGCRLISGTLAGLIQINATVGGFGILNLSSVKDVDGLVNGVTMYVAGGKVTLVADAATVQTVILVGKGTSGAEQLEAIDLTGTTPVVSVANWTELTSIVLGHVEAARTVTLSATAAQTTPSVQSTIQKVDDYFDGRYISSVGGFVSTIVTGRTTYPVTQLDVSVAAVNCLSPAEPGFKADLYAIIEYLNQSNELVDAVAAVGATGGAPDNTAQPQFLTGGSEGSASFSDWQDALNLLKQTRVNSVVVLTPDPAIHAALDAHCAYMGGIGRSERDGFVGLMNTAMTDVATKTEIKSQIVDLNTRHIRAWAQSIERFNSAGEREEFDPHFGGAVLAGMQAGSAIGESLTFKFMNVLSLRQHSSWNPTDDAEEMVQAGLVFAENVEGAGRRVVRNVTTHLTSDNLAFTEGSVNEATNYSVFTFRTNMEYAVGKKGFAGTVNAGTGVAIGTLSLLVDEEILVDYRSLFIELIVDVMEVSCEIAPIIPINFVKNTMHLITIQQTAA
jgi:hypothetical protein